MGQKSFRGKAATDDWIYTDSLLKEGFSKYVDFSSIVQMQNLITLSLRAEMLSRWTSLYMRSSFVLTVVFHSQESELV